MIPIRASCGTGEREDERFDGLVFCSDEEGDGRAQGRDLREREVHEDDLPLNHVQSQIRVGHQDDHGHHEGWQKKF